MILYILLNCVLTLHQMFRTMFTPRESIIFFRVKVSFVWSPVAVPCLLPFGKRQGPQAIMGCVGRSTNQRAACLSQPCDPEIISVASVNDAHMLSDSQINLIPSHSTSQQSDQYLHTTYESLYHSHGYALQSTVTNFYISLHCFVAKCLNKMFKNLHGSK